MSRMQRDEGAMDDEASVVMRSSSLRQCGPSSQAKEFTSLRRSSSLTIDDVDRGQRHSAGGSIAQRLQSLQKRGQTDWRKRVSQLDPSELPQSININAAAQLLRDRLDASPSRQQEDDALTPQTPLEERLGLLEVSKEGWKKRVNASDATQFSVAGKMALPPMTPISSHERKKKTPKPQRFKSKVADTTPAEKEVSTGSTVAVPKVFDEEFCRFFVSTSTDERINLQDEDLESLSSSTLQLNSDRLTFTDEDRLHLTLSSAREVLSRLVRKRSVKVQQRRGASHNPVKALAARQDLRFEYLEVNSGAASREQKRLLIKSLAESSPLSVEALAGLASKEDFGSVQLRRASDSKARLASEPMLPYKDRMLLMVKGRRHVQTRLVRPHYASVNQGDCFVLVTPDQVFCWIGEFSNVIERSRCIDIAQHIVASKDLGCSAGQVTTLRGVTPHPQFWRLLGADDDTAATHTGSAAGHPDEDELYELAVTATNMIYQIEGGELVPSEDSWASIPKIQMLGKNKVLVFDFGSEMYVWLGKSVPLDRRRKALKVAQEFWSQGYDYSQCDTCPIDQAVSLGTRLEKESVEKKAAARPEWALLAKVTQHMETILLREKFLDWPDFTRVIRVKELNKEKQGEEVKPCDAQPLVDWTPAEPDLELEGSHLGRGTHFFDTETRRHFDIASLSVTVWHVHEFGSTELKSKGQLHSGDSYVIRWSYKLTVTGRELSGAPSRHASAGRDRCAYWTWQGSDASTNDKGAAALLTVQLDRECGPQLRLSQGQEPPAFRRLFDGALVVHSGRRCSDRQRWRLYLVMGEHEAEARLLEVACSTRQLRSRACLILLDSTEGKLYLWRGNHALTHSYKVALSAVKNLKDNRPAEAGLEDVETLDVEEITEGKEPSIFFEALGSNNRQLYLSLAANERPITYTPRLFHMSSVSGVFQALPITAACHDPALTTPYPYTQHDLYSARQPALFLLDAGPRLWLWQGWRGAEEEGEGEVRWQAERRAAMHTAIHYQQLRRPTPGSAHLVWAGLEPLAFTNLFPTWLDRDDVAEINIKDGRKSGELLSVEDELQRLERNEFPPDQLMQRPLPEGVDPTCLDEYLAPQHFKEVLGLSKEEFTQLPAWKQNKLKQEKGLF